MAPASKSSSATAEPSNHSFRTAQRGGAAGPGGKKGIAPQLISDPQPTSVSRRLEEDKLTNLRSKPLAEPRSTLPPVVFVVHAFGERFCTPTRCVDAEAAWRREKGRWRAEEYALYQLSYQANGLGGT